MALDLYKYQPLNRQKHDIRLLKIENSAELAESTFALDELVKGGQTDKDNNLFTFIWNGRVPIRTSIQYVSLDDSLQYVALSYIWGDPSHKLPIIVDGAKVMVTKNLG